MCNFPPTIIESFQFFLLKIWGEPILHYWKVMVIKNIFILFCFFFFNFSPSRTHTHIQQTHAYKYMMIFYYYFLINKYMSVVNGNITWISDYHRVQLVKVSKEGAGVSGRICVQIFYYLLFKRGLIE